MNCKHGLCQQPIRRCPPQCGYPYCKGWQHMDGYHHCATGGLGVVAEPEPGTPAVVETPAGKPEGEVA